MTNTTNDYNTATTNRARALDTLIVTAESVHGAGDLLDMLGAVRLVELAADQARHAIAREARLGGFTWQEIGDALGTTRQNAQQRFSTLERVDLASVRIDPSASEASPDLELFALEEVDQAERDTLRDPLRDALEP